MKYLVKQSSDWADEFTAECFCMFDSKENAEFEIERLVKEGGYFGSNEGWEEGELCEWDFKIIEIPDEDAEVITKYLGKSFGTGLL